MSLSFKFLLSISLSTILYCAFGNDSIRMEQRGDNYFIIHQVDPGETLYSISQRYGVAVSAITQINRIERNAIEIGQFLEVPYGETKVDGKVHVVRPKETLYAISKKYEVSLEELKAWNDLRSNDLNVGQELIIGKATSEIVEVDSVKEADTPPSYDYFVQVGESLKSIADKFQVSVDSIKIWNELQGNDVRIGQKLIFPMEIDEEKQLVVTEVSDFESTSYGSKKRSVEEGGVSKVREEGVARRVDDSIQTNKYLALHRSLKVGTVFHVRNLMNNETIYVRVVGKLPETGINQNVMVRFTSICFDRLGILDDKALVEITYFER